jgi:galactitol 2-dehydrogenase (L-tagatose-forming)
VSGTARPSIDRPRTVQSWTRGARFEVSEIAAAVVYLASAASTYVTGAILSIDGGYTAW